MNQERPPSPPARRNEDRRLDSMERKIDSVDRRLGELRDWLIGEPEGSALGRQLLSRAVINANNIQKLNDRTESLEDWRTEWKGVWRFVSALGVSLGIVGTALGIITVLRGL